MPRGGALPAIQAGARLHGATVGLSTVAGSIRPWGRVGAGSCRVSIRRVRSGSSTRESSREGAGRGQPSPPQLNWPSFHLGIGERPSFTSLTRSNVPRPGQLVKPAQWVTGLDDVCEHEPSYLGKIILTGLSKLANRNVSADIPPDREGLPALKQGQPFTFIRCTSRT